MKLDVEAYNRKGIERITSFVRSHNTVKAKEQLVET